MSEEVYREGLRACTATFGLFFGWALRDLWLLETGRALKTTWPDFTLKLTLGAAALGAALWSAIMITRSRQHELEV